MTLSTKFQGLKKKVRKKGILKNRSTSLNKMFKGLKKNNTNVSKKGTI